MYKLIILLCTLWIPFLSHACSVKLLPDSDDFDKYSSIFTGEVIGIQLTEYEKRRLEVLHGGDKYQRGFSSQTLEHEITILVHKALTGNQAKKVTIKVSGCSVQIPSMYSNGIFFQTGKGLTIPIYNSEGQYYSELLFKVGRYIGLKKRDEYKR